MHGDSKAPLDLTRRVPHDSLYALHATLPPLDRIQRFACLATNELTLRPVKAMMHEIIGGSIGTRKEQVGFLAGGGDTQSVLRSWSMACTNPYGLPDKQWRFVQEYLLDLHATAAYQRAGYKARGASARAAAARLLTNVSLAAALDAERQRLAAALAITPERVLREYARLAFACLTDVSSWDTDGVSLVPSQELTPDQAAAIAEVSEETRVVVAEQGEQRTIKKRLKMHDKKGALDSLARHLKLFSDEEKPPPDIHVHVHTARERLADRVAHLAARHAEDATNGH
jgi:phage terminase small subunit